MSHPNSKGSSAELAHYTLKLCKVKVFEGLLKYLQSIRVTGIKTDKKIIQWPLRILKISLVETSN